MEVGQGPNWSCSAKEKIYISGRRRSWPVWMSSQYPSGPLSCLESPLMEPMSRDGRLDGRGWIIADPRNFLLTVVFIPALGDIRRPMRWVLRYLSWWVGDKGTGSWNWPLTAVHCQKFSAEIWNTRSVASTPSIHIIICYWGVGTTSAMTKHALWNLKNVSWWF
jgi:hypothetical protein